MHDVTNQDTVAVIVPTYRRPSALKRCLASLEQQSWRPDEVLAVCRAEGDPETTAYLNSWAAQEGICPCKIVTVTGPGQIAAIEAGIAHTECSIIVVIDDDVQMHPKWLERCLVHYADPRVVGVGGRDIIHTAHGVSYVPHDRVGQVTWFGRMIGNHHRGYGRAREVDILKGANMSLRRQYYTFDRRLRGSGAQVHNDAQLCLWARCRGGILIYDPNCVVDHYPAPRFDSNQRGAPSKQAIVDACHNETYILLHYLRWRQRVAFFPYSFLIGHRGNWAIGRWLIARLAGERVEIADRLLPSYQGKVLGTVSWLQSMSRHRRFRLLLSRRIRCIRAWVRPVVSARRWALRFEKTRDGLKTLDEETT